MLENGAIGQKDFAFCLSKDSEREETRRGIKRERERERERKRERERERERDQKLRNFRVCSRISVLVFQISVHFVDLDDLCNLLYQTPEICLTFLSLLDTHWNL